MKKFNTTFNNYRYDADEKGSNGLNREDSGSKPNEGTTRFQKDKRQRIKRTEKAVPQRRTDSDRTADGQREDRGNYPPKRSYNPNFDENNKLRKPGEGYNKDGYKKPYDPNRKPYDPDRKPYDPNKKSYSKGPGKGNFNKNNRNDRPGARPGNNKFGKRQPADYPKYPAPLFSEPVRLNRYLATAGLCSRREADEKILEGEVTVNGIVVTELGTKVQPEDIVRYKDDIVRSEKKVYLVMNKPKGFVTTIDDPHATKTVMDIVKNACKERIYPVGRLDKNSLGVLLFTNDGEITERLTHPSHNKKKVYQVSLDKPLAPEDLDRIAKGITLDDGDIRADYINYLDETQKEVGIEIHSGRNRIVRRIFEKLGYKVTKLDRVYYAGLTKKNLKRGAWRFLTPREVDALKSGMYE